MSALVRLVTVRTVSWLFAQAALVAEHPCSSPRAPVNGNISCEKSAGRIECQVRCRPGFAFAVQPAASYTCFYDDGRWEPRDDYPYSDCSGEGLPSSAYVHKYC